MLGNIKTRISWMGSKYKYSTRNELEEYRTSEYTKNKKDDKQNFSEDY